MSFSGDKKHISPGRRFETRWAGRSQYCEKKTNGPQVGFTERSGVASTYRAYFFAPEKEREFAPVTSPLRGGNRAAPPKGTAGGGISVDV